MNKEQIITYIDENEIKDVFVLGLLTKLPDEGDVTDEIVKNAIRECIDDLDLEDSDYQDNLLGWRIAQGIIIDVLKQQQ